MQPASVGQFAALGTALCWTLSALCFEAASRRVGSLVVNLVRMLLAFGFLCLWGLAARGKALPVDAEPRTWVWLLVSGYIGFFLGDLCLFRAFVLIGPRLSTLLMSLAPPVAAVMGWLVLGEALTPVQWAGMAVTLAGVSWVVLERRRKAGGGERPHSPLGILLGALGGAGQGIGLVLAKLGMDDYDPVAATQIRAIGGIVGFAVLLGLLGWYGRVWSALRQPKAMGLTTLGALLGPTIGVSLLLYATTFIKLGVAQTIVAIVPVLIIPFVIWIHKERVSARAVFGALLAVGGVSLLFLKA